MGVPGLWDVLRPAGQMRALAHLATEDGFVANPQGHRAYRIGIDASIWFFHALGGREGENPELRTLFFRCARLLAMPYLPIFVFDGPGRPKFKRGRTVGGKEHWMVNSLRTVLDAFGFECRTAPGEAEAELAFLNRIGAIDAVLSDDVDCFIFGAHTVMRNGSMTLSGNRKHATDDAQHVYMYRAEDIATHPDVGLSQGGLILVALLRGGDYDETGVSGCGVSTAHALARAGFGDTLLAAALSGPAALNILLPQWREDLREELRTNASGLGLRKFPSVARRISETFPSLDVLRCYTHPLTSERQTSDLAAYGLDSLWKHSADIGKIAHVCERFFEWGMEETVVKRFRTVIWPGAVLRTLLLAALQRDGQATSSLADGTSGPNTPTKALARSFSGIALTDSQGDDDVDHSCGGGRAYDNKVDSVSLIKTIHSTRRHASTDHMLEYRVEVYPEALVSQARAGMQGLRTVNQDSAKDPGAGDGSEEDDGEDGDSDVADPNRALRVWMPAPVVTYACPRLIKEFEAKQEKIAAKKAAKGNRKPVIPNMSSPIETKVNTKVTAKPKKPINSGEKEMQNWFSTPNKGHTKSKGTKGRGKEQNIIDLLISSTKESSTQPTSSPKSRNSEPPAKPLKDDPFLVSAAPLIQTTRRARIPSENLPQPGPFPMPFDTDKAPGFPIAKPDRSRKHSISCSASPSSDIASASELIRKSPRKSVAHSSPSTPTKSRSPSVRSVSPSPVRPLLRAKMKSKNISNSVATNIAEEVIIISSDSDTPAPPPARPKFRKSRTNHQAPPQRLDLSYDSEVINLT